MAPNHFFKRILPLALLCLGTICGADDKDLYKSKEPWFNNYNTHKVVSFKENDKKNEREKRKFLYCSHL